MTSFYDLFRNPYVIGPRERWLGDLTARNPDGSGNNLSHSAWGVAGGLMQRVTTNSYLDGLGSRWDLPVQETQGRNPAAMVGTAPQPREITSRVMAQPTDSQGHDIDLPDPTGSNEFFQFFGQFLTHDLVQAASNGAETPLFLNGLPFPFSRTPFELGSDAYNDEVRQQINNKTCYLDLSQVYGPSQTIEDLLRAKASGGGLSANLLTGATGVLPTFQEVATDKGLAVASVIRAINPGATADLFATGDNRANQQTPLSTHHIIWMRNHNWHVEQLREQFPNWSENRLFEAARALNEADWQSVVYNEYLTKLLGPDALSDYSGYDADVNPSIINEWTTVAFRFGHDQSSNDLGLIAENGRVVDTMTLAESFQFKADGLRDDAGLGDWVRGQLARVTQAIDGKVVQGNRNLLFGGNAVADLSVLDIQRGRDHGVGHFNELREGLGLRAYDSFDDFGRVNGIGAGTLAALKDIYDNDIDALDSIVGGLLEKADGASMLGRTFTILNVMQFEALRDGDRFFYLNRLSPELRAMVDSTTMAEILERNTEIDHVYREAFLSHTRIGGNDADNTRSGGGGRDLLIGFAGNDRLTGNGGNDDLYGDQGRDALFGGSGSDALYGGRDNDTLNGGSGQDYLDGGTSNDVLLGMDGDDFLFGGAGKDRLRGGAGDDYLNGGAGADRLWGDAGRDVFAFDVGTGRDVVHGFRSVDKLDLSAFGFDSVAEARAAMSRSGDHTVIALGGGDEVVLAGVDWTLHSRHLILDA